MPKNDIEIRSKAHLKKLLASFNMGPLSIICCALLIMFNNDEVLNVCVIAFIILSHLLKYHFDGQNSYVGSQLALGIGILEAKYLKCDVNASLNSFDQLTLIIPVIQIILI